MDLQPWFTAVVASGVGGAVLAGIAVVIGIRRRSEELALVGGAFVVASLGMAFHGLAGLRQPGLVGDVGMRIAIPAGMAMTIPVLLPHRDASRWLLHRWRSWLALAIGTGAALAAIDLVSPGHGTPRWFAFALAAATAIGGTAIAHRQWYLFRIGRRRSSLIAAAAVATSAALGIAVPWTTPGSTTGWILVVVDAIALAVIVIALVTSHRVGTDVSTVLAPIVAHEPLTALEVGLAPEIRAFVAALGDRDGVTRQHVVRTSALALRVAMRAGLQPGLARNVALGALLHDIGKLLVPVEILDKPDALSDAEFDIVKQHPVIGARIVSAVPSLEDVTTYVAQHHERPDGRGYPNGLEGAEISLASGIVSVCDAWDAMVEDRPYRRGMSPDQAASIITAGAGSQWRADACELLLQEVRMRPRTDATIFDQLDRLPHDRRDDCTFAGDDLDDRNRVRSPAAPRGRSEHA